MTMRFNVVRGKSQLAAAVLLAAFGIAGCGGGGGGSSSPPIGNSNGNQPASNTQAGRDLNTVITSSSGSNSVPTQDSVSHVQSEYASLVASNPNDAPSNAGFAISTAALGAAMVNSYSGYQFTAAAVSTSQPSSLGKVSNLLCIWNLPNAIASGSTPKLSPLDILPATSAGKLLSHTQSTLTYAQAQAQLALVDVQLKKAETSVDFVLNHTSSTFTFVIANPVSGSNQPTIGLGHAEFEALLAAIGLTRSIINASIAYNIDPGTFTYGPVSTQFSSAYAHGGTITPSQYLPASPFATLNSGGATDIGTVKSELIVAATAAENTITDVQGRNNSGYLLNPGTLVTNAQLNKYVADIQKYLPYLSQSETVAFATNGPTTTINLSAFFAHPPTDLKALAPTINVAAPDQFGQVVLSISPTNYPGLVGGYPTFGGLFPNGDNLLPTDQYFSYTGDQTKAGAVLTGLFQNQGF